MSTGERLDLRFPAGDTECAGWLYRPAESSGAVPLVVLGHGMGAIREMGLDRYAERFAAAGFAALAFDYRHFGASGGEPRQLLDIDHQLADWQAAIDYARTLAGIDPDRIALWGTAFAGGHVIEAAARDGKVAAVISQAPFTSWFASARAAGLRTNVKLFRRARDDQRSVRRGTGPVRVKLVGPPGSTALMAAPDSEGGYRALVPPGVAFNDRVLARGSTRVMRYNPGRAAARVKCPILFCVCDRDSIAPSGTTQRLARKAPRGKIVRYPIGHFDAYHGVLFERVVADQVAFLHRHLTETCQKKVSVNQRGPDG